ncbi:MAG: chemotaxis protein CheA [Planctomycetota bacterium]
MSIAGFDPEIIQDFLTESGELLDQLEGDLVELESRPEDPDLLNQVFRALHTIKGSASFLALTNLVEIAHAAESALNAARAGEVVIDQPAMDLLLGAIDVLKSQFDQLHAGETELRKADSHLVEGLTVLAEGGASSASNAAAPAAQASAVVDGAASGTADAGATAVAGPTAETGPFGAEIGSLELPSDKADLIEFLVPDLEETLDKIDEQLGLLAEDAARDETCKILEELGDSLTKNAEFFDVAPMLAMSKALLETSRSLPGANDHAMDAILPRMRAVTALLAEQTRTLNDRKVLNWNSDTLLARLGDAVKGEGEVPIPAPESALEELLRLDGVLSNEEPDAASQAVSPESPAPAENTAKTAGATPRETQAARKTTDAPAADAKAGGEPGRKATTVEATIRVEVRRLESLMNLVGELVLQKNRISAISRRLSSMEALPTDDREQVEAAGGDLDRVTSDIQLAVMRTRMQPLDKLFGKYPRLIRDLAGKTGKKITLEIKGGDTEVDKSVIEELGDPLVHLMRNSADHGLEPPEERLAAGKGETGTITLDAAHEGSQVRIRIIDDGRGLNRERISAKAVERGLVNESDLSGLTDQEVARFIFLPGFSTADEVSDLSGRGVGMDVVRTNIEKLKGSIDVDTTPGQGTVFTITIPLTVAIMPAMMVAIGEETYAIPLASILEIVRPEDQQLYSIGEQPVVRLRDSVLPLVSGPEVFDLPGRDEVETPFAVVMRVNEKSVGLMVTKPLGQQEIVIKPLDGTGSTTGPVSGATVRDDGGVSLIVDVPELVRLAEGRGIAVNPATV